MIENSDLDNLNKNILKIKKFQQSPWIFISFKPTSKNKIDQKYTRKQQIIKIIYVKYMQIELNFT